MSATPSNDALPPVSELVRLTAQTRFLISALDQYAEEPDENKWAVVLMAKEDLRETSDDIWTRYLKYHG